MAEGWKNRIVGRKRVSPEKLAANPRNWRTHPKAQADALAGLLDQVGWVQDVIVNKRTGLLVDGHLRVELAVERGEGSIPVLYVDLDEAEEALVLASLDPLGAMAEANAEMLGELLGSAEANSDALAEMLRKVAVKAHVRTLGQTEPDDTPPPPATETPDARTGDLFILGDHRLLCGDSTSQEDVLRLLDGAEPRVMLTDPPYGVSYDASWRDDAGINTAGPAEPAYLMQKDRRTNTTISGDTKADWSDAFELVPSLDVAYVWHASAHAAAVALGLERIGFEIKQQIIWRKPHFVLSRQHYHWQHEPCWYARRSGSRPFNGSLDQSTIWDAASPKMLMNPGGDHEVKVDHPTQKPVALYTRPIDNHLDAGEVFYEPFGGSGSAIIAAEMTDRRCFSMELDPKYIDVIVARWEAFTGKTAERIRE